MVGTKTFEIDEYGEHCHVGLGRQAAARRFTRKWLCLDRRGAAVINVQNVGGQVRHLAGSHRHRDYSGRPQRWV